MKRLFIWIIVIVAVVASFILALPSLFSSDEIWAKVNPILEEQVGRKIAVSGTRELSLYPNIALVLGDVEIGSNVSSDAPLARLEELRVSVDLMSLFSGNININELSLTGADISLIVDKNGVANWQNDNDAPAQLPEKSDNPDDPLGTLIADSVNEQTTPNITDDEPLNFSLATLSVQNFKINNGRLTYENQQTGIIELAENIDIDVTLGQQNKSLSLDGQVTWQKQTVDFNLNSFNIDSFLNDQATPLAFKMNAAPLTIDLNGQMQNGDKLKFDGKMAVKSGSIQQMANWLKVDLSTVNDTALTFDSGLKINGDNYQISNLKLAAFASKINGVINFSLANMPNVYGKLSIDQVDYAKIIPPSAAVASSPEWSGTPLNLSILSQINSNVELNIGQFNYDGINATNLTSTLIVRKARAMIPLKMNVFGGQIIADIAAQLSGKTITLNAKIQADEIKAGDALKTLDITEKLNATAFLTTEVSSNGNSIRGLMSQLNGTGKLELKDGVISGVALADALAPEIANIDLSLNSPEKLASFALDASKNLFTQNVSGILTDSVAQNTGSEKQTKFVKATMSFNIKQGVLDNQDLEVQSESIVIRGAGQVDLGQKTINYRIIPKVLKQTDSGTSERMTIPALVTGPWSDPNIAIDYAYAIENSSTISKMRDKTIKKVTDKITEKVTDKIVEKVKQKVGDELGNQVTDQVGKLLGIKSNDSPKSLPEETPKNDAEKIKDAGKLLNNLFNN